ncbi:MAG: hypothetical protein HW421_1199 [Ignavibacteria bacterium]|nr:hypothetical protein [Ignavibacteria bacterium]
MKPFFVFLALLVILGSCSPDYKQIDIILLDVSPSRTEYANNLSLNSSVRADSFPGSKKIICLVGPTPDQSILEIEYPFTLDIQTAKILEDKRKFADDSLKAITKHFIEKKQNFSNLIQSIIKCVDKYKILYPFSNLRIILYSDGIIEEPGEIDLNHNFTDKFHSSYKADLSRLKGCELQLRTFTNSSEYTTFSSKDFKKVEAFWVDFVSKTGMKLTYIGSSKDFN